MKLFNSLDFGLNNIHGIICTVVHLYNCSMLHATSSTRAASYQSSGVVGYHRTAECKLLCVQKNWVGTTNRCGLHVCTQLGSGIPHPNRPQASNCGPEHVLLSLSPEIRGGCWGVPHPLTCTRTCTRTCTGTHVHAACGWRAPSMARPKFRV